MDDDLIERLTAETYENDQHGIWTKPRNPEGKEAADRITALIAAGDKLAEYAGHDEDCPARWGEFCGCGYTEAVKAWKDLTK